MTAWCRRLCRRVGVRENGMRGRRMFAMKEGRGKGIFTLEEIP